MRIIYEADDGSTFKNPEDCKQYEEENLKPMEDILGITSGGNILTYASEYNYGKSFIEVAEAIYFKTDKAIAAFKEHEGYYQSFSTNGYKNFKTGVIYRYDSEFDEYITLDDIISRCQEKLNCLNMYAEEMNKYVNAST